jgi:hypothetical protein
MRMSITRRAAAAGILIGLPLVALLLPQLYHHASPQHILAAVETRTEDRHGQEEFELLRLRDPATGVIPADIRRRELAMARRIPAKEGLSRAAQAGSVAAARSSAWVQRGPPNIAGRTRALAIDALNPEVLLAGAVSGGMWRSSDGGRSWMCTTDPQDLHSATTVVQDPRSGKTSVWYYGTGEARGNSASGGGAPYSGDGILKSTDNGLSWNPLPSTVSGTPHQFDQVFDYIWKLAVDPSAPEDEVYAATVGGINRSTDGGQTWSLVLGSFSNDGPRFTDVGVTSTGVVYATLSEATIVDTRGARQRGIWRSPDGIAWTRITPPSPPWPSIYRRIVIGISPADEDEVYFLADTPGAGLETVYAGIAEGTSLWRYRYAGGDGTGNGGIWVNRSSNLPAFGGEAGDFASQQSFNLVVAVKPDDPNVVFVGGTNLYRSTTGFATGTGTAWIGGYAGPDDLRMYPNQHADQHALVFRPDDPEIVFAGHDGGVSVTSQITASAVRWESRSAGFVTTQFYALAIDRTLPNDDVILGGMQDNGTWGVFGSSVSQAWTELLSGDGAFCAIAPGRGSYYVSAQYGLTYRLLLDQRGDLQGFARIDPRGGEGYLFVNPFVFDPSDPNIMYMAGGSTLWRNTSITSIPLGSNDPASFGWVTLAGAASTSGPISALSVSTDNPPHRLYCGTAAGQVLRLDNAQQAGPSTRPLDLTTGTTLPRAAYVNCLAVDPEDGSRLILVFSNYSVPSVFLTADGGTTWTDVSGNLEEFPDGSGGGPSVRWASILHLDGLPVYYLGTSTGLYSTAALAGGATTWVQEGASSIGNVVVTMVESRPADGLVVAATHGRGVFSSNAGQNSPPGLPVSATVLESFPNPFNGSTTFRFRIEHEGPLTLTVYDLQGRTVEKLVADTRLAGIQPDVVWTPENLASGIYLCRLLSGTHSRTVKVAYLR